ncbi:MAG: hypothetical protein P8173_16455 [Gammaproteobacteria bacterium]|jgi:hypothetical protein
MEEEVTEVNVYHFSDLVIGESGALTTHAIRHHIQAVPAGEGAKQKYR